MFKRVDHVALHVADASAAARFYRDVLGFELVAERPGTAGFMIAYVRLGNTMIELTTRPGGEPMSGFHLALEPENFTTAYSYLKDKGLEILVEARRTTPRGTGNEDGAQRAVFRGPHGEMIEMRGR